MPRAPAEARARFLASGADEALPIIDAHHHFFDLDRNRHPWLQGERLASFRYGDYGAICRNFLPEDYLAAASGHLVVGSVLMEGEWDPADPIGEMAWATEVAQATGRPDAAIGQIWLDREDVGAVIAAYRGMELVKSVRHKPAATSRAEHHPRYAAKGSMRDPRWRDGYAMLGQAGLHFDLQTPWWHLDEAAELAADMPQTLIILNHAGLPADRSAEGLRAWRAALDRLARQPNVVAKISGIGVPGQAWTLELQQPVVDGVIAAFGVERCAFASNYPVDGLCAPFGTIFEVFKAATRRFAPEQRLALFHDNAARWYGVGP
ncbi:thioesterase [Bosea sp. Leaf344]|uniref:amidohydrolase family protein n=1 Tax=Bosea sp. Leaf344 TaxID=1736346 RepID=UPI0006F35370|nr:amidohydrolase family protein [Bosea sp. Leaf344]KQU50624.1 thioesterase [Bosea sp. Leaf344]